MNKKPLLILVDSQGYSSGPLIDRLEFEKFSGEVVRTFNETDTVDTLAKAGVDRKCTIVTDSLTTSGNDSAADRTAGTYSMVRKIHQMCPGAKVIVCSGDFFELDKKLTKNEAEFIDAKKKESYDLLIKKIYEYADLN